MRIEEQIRRLYASGQSQRTIAGKLKTTQPVVSAVMRALQIPSRTIREAYYARLGRKPPILTAAKVRRLYRTKSTEQIAKHLHVSRAQIYRLMKKHKIRPRTYAQASSFMNDQRTIKFNQHQEQLVYGSMLGDACLHRSVMKSNKTKNRYAIYKLAFTHCKKQLPYLKYKQSIIGGCKIGTKISGHGSIVHHFTFSHTPTLKKVAAICHNKRHKKYVTQKWLDKVDWEGIAYWFQDDGCLMIPKNRRPVIIFYTNSYSRIEVKLLQRWLLQKTGLRTCLKKVCGGKEARAIVAHRQKEIRKFLYRIKRWVVPCLRYKVRSVC